MKIFFLIATTFLCACSHNYEANINITLEQECDKAADEESIQCKILNDNDLSLDEKQQSLGFYYMLRPNKIEGDCDKSRYWFEKAARKNNAEALNGLGMSYYLGCNNDKDFKKAEEYYLLAYYNHSKQAAANLGNIYVLGGFGIQKDLDQALKWFKLAINDTPLRGYKGLSQVYFYLENYKLAHIYTVKAAQMGDAESQHNLGYMYEAGLFIDKDIEKAKYWYEKSAAQGFPLAFDKLENLSK